MRAAEDRDLLRRLEDILPELEGGPGFAARLDDDLRGRLLGLMPGLKERAKTLVELFQSAAFLAAERPIQMDGKAAALLDDEARALLARARDALVNASWTEAELEAAIRQLAEAEGVKLGKIAQPLRAALTGSASSPPIFNVLVALGREESLGRLSDQFGS
jgi:glutamyl-tRNA synthetase